MSRQPFDGPGCAVLTGLAIGLPLLIIIATGWMASR